jgi:hypothetical protein
VPPKKKEKLNKKKVYIDENIFSKFKMKRVRMNNSVGKINE